jgi:hypothetical protein
MSQSLALVLVHIIFLHQKSNAILAATGQVVPAGSLPCFILI